MKKSSQSGFILMIVVMVVFLIAAAVFAFRRVNDARSTTETSQQ